MHVSLRAEIAEKIAKQQQLTYTMGLKLYRICTKRKLNPLGTLPRNDLLSRLYWGTQWTMEIS